jgi:hypothetical protein
MTKYRVVVNAAQTWKSSFGDECGGVAERGVHLEALNTADAVPEGRRGHEHDLSRGKQVRFLRYCERIG